MSSGVLGGSTANANAYQNHPLRDAASTLGMLSPQVCVDVMSVAQRKFLEQMLHRASEQCDAPQTANGARLDDVPELRTPVANDASSSDAADVRTSGDDVNGGVSGSAKLTKLLGDLMSIISANSLQDLKQRSDIWNKMSKAAQDSLSQVSDAFRQATDDAKAATDAAEQAAAAAKQAAADAKAADEAVDAAQKRYDDAVEQGLPADQLQLLNKALEQAKQKADELHGKADALQADATKKLDTATELATRACEYEEKVDEAVNRAMKQYGTSAQLRGAISQKLSGVAELTAVLGKLQELISSGNVKELESKHKLFIEKQKMLEAKQKKESEEFQKQEKKAEEMQKTMGCIGKIVGWAITAVSFAAAAFTGGASLALAAVGLALAVGDEISQATTGVSFMDKLMQPVMDAILKPLMNMISSLITKALVACGVDKQKAELAGAILGAIVTGVALVAAAFVGASVVKAVASKVMDAVAGQLAKVMDSAIGKMLLELTEKVSEKSGLQALSSRTATAMTRMRRAIGVEAEEDGMLLASRFEKASTVLDVGNQVSQAAGGIVVGIERAKAMGLLADIKEDMYDIKLISDLLRKAVDTFAEHNRVLVRLMQDVSDAINTNMLACKQSLRPV
ncbi:MULTISPECIES: type III secretion system translocon subunit SctE [Burkholderia]|uniref:type III secretion system translocon subunit SctE n=1 Tax=Burkholderia TaxID=32008 RepID=UPI00075BEF04|nr:MULTISPECIES: type III secretion system translocon subunit SctE [Burkholderia]AOJ73534.1 translocator protein BipB [Burkholderia savannae]KVG38923.1 translocator protein BipB [Burkholderia sp. MSMB0265]KVG81649.1 translocator protein BipB [Burkholderia sp. MSMB2040]KVG98806.1 translocator protein BipB [Burkholderia sp. MSMB2042]KVG98987.1 translocator protein BipB [Burkholderia sp. MSMB2041]